MANNELEEMNDPLVSQFERLWNNYRADQLDDDFETDQLDENSENEKFFQENIINDFEQQNLKEDLYIYLDFTENLEIGSRNRKDIYKESLGRQFEKIQKKLIKNLKFEEFVYNCFPAIKSAYYVSLPSFNRKIETIEKRHQKIEYIPNMIIRPEKTVILSSVIPKEYDLILIGDLVFRNELISFEVKGIDLIDINIEKFGELRIECSAAFAIEKNERRLPDYGMEGKDLYKPFLTRDIVLSLCNKVYPIKNPEKAIRVFEKWEKYIDFREYFLDVQSQRNESVESVEFIKSYVVKKSVYKKNEDIYEKLLLDNNKKFIRKEQVFLREFVEDAIEFPLVKIEIAKNLAEINENILKNKKNRNFERELKRFTRLQVALSKNNPEEKNSESEDDLVYLNDRIAFETEDTYPDCEDIIQKYAKKLLKEERSIDEKYRFNIVKEVAKFREDEKLKLSKEVQQEIDKYNYLLDINLKNDIENNTDKDIKIRYNKKVKEIEEKYKKQEKKLKKNKKEPTEKEEKNKNDLEEITKLLIEEKENIPLREWYVERNNNLKEKYQKESFSRMIKELDKTCKEKENLLGIKFTEMISNEKKEIKKEIEKEKNQKIEERKVKYARRHFYIYFKVEDTDLKSEILEKYKYLIYDNRAEKAKIDRQRKTLESFYYGYVKNPFLASYLFAPETLGKSENEFGEIEWFGNRLNDSQKKAVRKALASNSLFLLQGPPGTGKTEVIAEITAQCVKQGKKVLISSETHKAIDNVFERLPKIPEIRPLRLIPSQSNKGTEYSPEKLVDNLYQSISSRLDKRIQQYENFNEMKNSFSEKKEELRYRYNQVLNLSKECKEIQEKKINIQRDIASIDSYIEGKRSNLLFPLEEEQEQYNNILLYIDKGKFWEEIEKSSLLKEIGNFLYNILIQYDFFSELDTEKIKKIYCISLDEIRDNLKFIEKNSSSMSIEQKRADIKSKMAALRDPDTDDILEDKEEEYAGLKKQLIALKKITDEVKNDINYSELKISEIIQANKLADNNSRTRILKSFIEIKEKITEYIIDKKNFINNCIFELSSKIDKIKAEIIDLKEQKRNLQNQIEKFNEEDSYLNYRNKNQELRKEIVEFFNDFEISEEYSNYLEAIEIIERRWNDIEKNQEKLSQENSLKIPMYKNIRKYLSDEEILEEDRISYTKNLFDNANVFGITCTSREYYSESSMKALREYKLGNINIRNVGIDVVIVDEVSKSSFLDLMIPVLYGKTVILVGDHRQLPPLYDLKHMREDDFDDLDNEKIDYTLNKQYQKLYETCFFKELFERVPNDYKIMLDKQYRCHSDIMDVFNHFYSTNGKGLSIGLANQNDLKNHDLLIKNKGVTLIEPQNHIYFVNCTNYESRLDTDSSSIINTQESKVVCHLLKMMDEEYGNMIEDGKIKNSVKKDERKSIGVICTYRDQARYIKSELKGIKFNNFSQKREEKLIINTVDDFQGDERDIIIVSMVRNPKNNNYNTDFIDQFERINVALSRARCMLIIVGAQEFLSRSSINLPDINGNKALDKHAFPVYRAIIRTIQAKGKLLQASDIIEEVEYNEK